MKIIALDVGDVWVGSALSDSLGITCRPYRTVQLDQLKTFLQEAIAQENVTTVVVGYPITVSGTASAQTKKVEVIFDSLKAKLKEVNGEKINWVLWDERFSSQRASSIAILTKKKQDIKTKKRESHSLAAAFIMQTYLDSKVLHETGDEDDEF